MELKQTFDVISIVIQLIFLEGILSIDNAAVLGALVSKLPTDKPTPYPKSLHFLQRFTDKYFGMQQKAALKVGLLGAYAGRAIMLLMAAWIIHNPILKFLGAIYLIKLAVEYLAGADDLDDEEEFAAHHQATAFWMVVLNVELADLAFSLDNVVAAVALSDKLWIVMIGVALGIITMRFAASIFTWLITREPVLATGAYLVVLNIGVELILSDFWGIEIGAWTKFAVSVATLALCVVYVRVKPLHVLSPVLRGIVTGVRWLNSLFDLILSPFVLLRRMLGQLLRAFFRPIGKIAQQAVNIFSSGLH